jgi:cytochrome c biogenesis protein CcdA
MSEITLLRIITLSFADAINPCAFAVMTMVLVSILIANPENKRKVLYGGLYFTTAVFIGYFIYGLIMIRLFKSFIEFTSVLYPYLVNVLAVFAIILGLFNIKDYLYYKPGGFATEMPLKFRPKVKLLIKNATTPRSAFLIGIFVTLFLLPCTIGPYIIASGSLSALDFLKTIPWLIVYNLIFIIPMIAITLIVYFGVSSVDNLSNWKERNIKIIHLIIGLLLIILGILILTKII